MREIDQVRITLLRMFRGAVRLPQEIIDELLKPFLHTQDAAIKVQAYGRGLLARFRDHNLLFRAPFNTQARVLHDNFMVSGHTPYTSTVRFQGEARVLLEGNEANIYWRRRMHDAVHLPQFTLNDWPGFKAIWGGRASRRSRRALELDRGWWGRTIRDEPLALFRRWLRYTEKRMTWYDAHHRLQWTQASSPAYWRIMRAHGLSVAQIRNILAGTLRLSDVFKGPPKGTSLAWQEDWS